MPPFTVYGYLSCADESPLSNAKAMSVSPSLQTQSATQPSTNSCLLRDTRWSVITADASSSEPVPTAEIAVHDRQEHDRDGQRYTTCTSCEKRCGPFVSCPLRRSKELHSSRGPERNRVAWDCDEMDATYSFPLQSALVTQLLVTAATVRMLSTRMSTKISVSRQSSCDSMRCGTYSRRSTCEILPKNSALPPPASCFFRLRWWVPSHSALRWLLSRKSTSGSSTAALSRRSTNSWVAGHIASNKDAP